MVKGVISSIGVGAFQQVATYDCSGSCGHVEEKVFRTSPENPLPREKIVIAGPGRAGTTFLVRVLTKLGLETGWSPEFADDFSPVVAKNGSRGSGFEVQILEYVWWQYFTPRIVKSPVWSFRLRSYLDSGFIKPLHVFIPVRDLEEVGVSRVAAGLPWAPEALGANSADHQSLTSACALGAVVSTCMTRGIPFTLMEFPCLVQSPTYCWDRLSRGIPELQEVGEQAFVAAFSELGELWLRSERGT